MAALDRPVKSVTTAPQGYEGEGFPVRRAFAGVDLADLDPFIHLDQMGEVEYAPGEPKGTPWHPHRGFETVTYMIDGIMEHQDSEGGGGLITNGDTQWMTAGSGLLHIETPPEVLSRVEELVSTPDASSVRAHHREAAALDLIDLAGPTRHLVVNHKDGRTRLEVSLVEQLLGTKAAAEIPRSRSLAESFERAIPLMEENPKDPAARAIVDLVDHLLGRPRRRDRSLLARVLT